MKEENQYKNANYIKFRCHVGKAQDAIEWTCHKNRKLLRTLIYLKTGKAKAVRFHPEASGFRMPTG
jgi:hypothetical protein